jgi:hypothetical protein
MLPLIGQTNLEAIIWCSGFGSCLVFEHGELIVAVLREAGAFLGGSLPRVGATAISNLYKTEQILISHPSSFVVEGFAHLTPFAGGSHR